MNYVKWSDEELVAELLDVEEGLTEWEVSFAEDVGRRLKTFGSLTPGERDKAVEVLERVEERRS